MTLEEQTTDLSEKFEEQSPTLTDAQKTACQNFASLFANTAGNADSFLFFTDPHLSGSSDVSADFSEALNEILAVYNNTPTSACVCGGDWLNNRNTKGNASWILGKIDGAMKRRFKDYLLVLGNHDTNYQGDVYMQSGADGTYDRDTHTECILSNTALHNLWCRDKDALYFDVKIDSGMYYIFDTGLDWYPDMDAYRWEQIDWFATRIATNDCDNSAGLLHIAKNGTITPFAQNIAAVANAYNNRTTITLNDKTYDFSASTGCFRFMVAGHTHADEVLTVNNIPVVITANLRVVAGVYSFDLMLADYGAKTLYVVRVGSGDNRTITMAEALN